MDQGWTESDTPFHAGEIAAQEKVGVSKEIRTFARRAIRPFMPDQHRQFFRQLPILYVAYMDEEGYPRATALAGKPGFLNSPDPKSLDVAALPHPSDPLSGKLREGVRLGLLGLEMHTRRRNRLNATISLLTKGGFRLAVDQSFGNCPQYILTRQFAFTEDPEAHRETVGVRSFAALDKGARSLIEAADTFFVASGIEADPEDKTGGADMSHRGGKPGFVKVDGNVLTIPDYAGNFHFNTFGNFLKNPKAGLLFIDFETGDVLQLTGDVEMIWDKEPFRHLKGAERGWRFTLKEGLLLEKALPLKWEGGEPSLNSQLTGTWQEAARIETAEATRNEWRSFEVVDIVQESSVIKSFYLSPKQEGTTLPFRAGQFLPIRVPAGEEGNVLTRTYTISSAPLDQSYRISVKKDGLVSGYLHDRLQVGDVIEARGPRGRFHIDPNPERPALLVAGGVGITPMISMMRQVVQDGFRLRKLKSVTLLHVARTSLERAFYDDALELTKGTQGLVRYASLLSRPAESERQGVDFQGAGHLNADTLEQFLPDGDFDVYLCGPAGFMQSAYNHLRALNVPDADIHAEAFGPSSLIREKEEKVGEAMVTFASSGSSHLWTVKDGSLLDFAERHGLSPAFGCRGGSCGSCAVTVKAGGITYPEAITADVEAGQALICCARPVAGTEDLELDI